MAVVGAGPWRVEIVRERLHHFQSPAPRKTGAKRLGASRATSEVRRHEQGTRGRRRDATRSGEIHHRVKIPKSCRIVSALL